jgi:glucokinase
MDLILAGDIGGTNTRLALYDSGNLRETKVLKVYPSGDYESLQTIVVKFMEDVADVLKQGRLVRAGFGVAGPVEGEIVKLTNLPWVVDTRRIAERLGIAKATFVNDFSANCYAVPRLGKEDVHQVGGGKPVADHPIVVLGAGTGLGEAFMVWGGDRYIVVPSEGGHTDFAPRNPLESRLLEFLTERFGRVSYERVVSGPGLVNVYEFLREREGLAEAPQVKDAMRNEDHGAVITRHAMDHSDPLSDRALDLFVSVYGAEAGNLALKLLARGGVYLAGGIAQKVLARLEEGGFRYGFEQKGRYTHFLESVPTYVITHPQPGLMGAAVAACEL